MHFAPFESIMGPQPRKIVSLTTLLFDASERSRKPACKLQDFYCTDPVCDCRKVMVHVIMRGAHDPEAIMNFGWSTLSYYLKWGLTAQEARDLQQGCLDPLSLDLPQSSWLLEWFQGLIEARRSELQSLFEQRYVLTKIALKKQGQAKNTARRSEKVLAGRFPEASNIYDLMDYLQSRR